MSVGSYLAALSALIVVLGGVISCGTTLQRRLVPDWEGTVGATAVAVCSVTVLIVLAEVLGTAHALRRTPLVIAAAVIGGLSWWGRPPKLPRPAPAPNPHHGVSAVGAIAVICVAVVVAHLLVAIHTTGQTGVLFIDSLEYHLTFAAHFATTGATTGVIHVSPGDATSYYPLNDELLNGVGMVLFNRDTLSLLLTGVDFGLVLLAAHAFGAEFGRGTLAVCAITPVLAILGSLDASAPNDWASLWPMIAAAAFMVRMGRPGSSAGLRNFAMFGLALGLACGTKFDLLGPSLALALAALVVVRSRWLTQAGVTLGAAIIAGGYWYVRNAVAVGSPLPGVHIPGLPEIPMSVSKTQGFSVAHYLTNGAVWHHYLLPGLGMFFGAGWPAVIAVVVVGVVVAAGRGSPPVLRLLAGVTVIGIGLYLVTPTTALGPPGHPFIFWVNLRYAFPPISLGFLLAAVRTPVWRRPGVLAAVFAAVLGVVCFSDFDWAVAGWRQPAVALAVSLIVVAALAHPVVRRHWRLIAGGVVAAVVIAGYPLQQRYLHDRYRSTATPQQALIARLARTSDIRVGVGGRQVQFPFEGPTFGNPVTYLGQQLPDHAFELFTSCRSWRAAVANGHYDIVVIENVRGIPPNLYRWTVGDPAARLLFRNPFGSIFAVGPEFGGIATCHN